MLIIQRSRVAYLHRLVGSTIRDINSLFTVMLSPLTKSQTGSLISKTLITNKMISTKFNLQSMLLITKTKIFLLSEAQSHTKKQRKMKFKCSLMKKLNQA